MAADGAATPSLRLPAVHVLLDDPACAALLAQYGREQSVETLPLQPKAGIAAGILDRIERLLQSKAARIGPRA